nr:MAG TPA: hypothetical protein [Caudoviricetes sp.]
MANAFVVQLEQLREYRKQRMRVCRGVDASLESIRYSEVSVFEPYPIKIQGQRVSNEGVVIDAVKSFYKAVVEFMKGLWNRVVMFFKWLGQTFGILKRKTEKVKEEYKDGKIALERARAAREAQAQQRIDKGITVDDAFKSEVSELAYAYGKPEHFVNDENMTQILKSLKSLAKVTPKKPTVPEGMGYAIQEKHFKYFGYYKGYESLDIKQLAYQMGLNKYFLALTLFAVDKLNPDHVIDTMVNALRGKKEISINGFRKEVTSKLLEPFKDYRLFDQPHNFTDKERIQYKSTDILKTYESANNPSIGFRDALRLLLPEIKPAVDKERAEYDNEFRETGVVSNYVQHLDNTLSNMEINRQHLYRKDGATIREGFMISERNVDKLFKDHGIEAKGKVGKELGKAIITLAKYIDEFVNDCHFYWANLHTKQTQLLNNQLNALHAPDVEYNPL